MRKGKIKLWVTTGALRCQSEAMSFWQPYKHGKLITTLQSTRPELGSPAPLGLGTCPGELHN
jgi:hypothetical protein